MSTKLRRNKKRGRSLFFDSRSSVRRVLFAAKPEGKAGDDHLSRIDIAIDLKPASPLRAMPSCSGGVTGPTEPSGIPITQILLARPRVYRRPLARSVLRSSRRRFTCPQVIKQVGSSLWHWSACAFSLPAVARRRRLADMGRMGGRYPLGVPVVPGRSSLRSRRKAIIERAGMLSIAYFRFFLNNYGRYSPYAILFIGRCSSVVEQRTCNA